MATAEGRYDNKCVATLSPFINKIFIYTCVEKSHVIFFFVQHNNVFSLIETSYTGFSLTVLSLLAPPCGRYKINFTVKPELVFWLILPSRTGSDNSRLVFVFFDVCRSSRAVLQPDVVPQPRPRPHVHPSDRLGQRPLHPALGQEEALHPGSLHRHAHRGGTVPQRVADR